jgi:hypothetical protein
MNDGASVPATVDQAGPNGASGYQNALIRYSHALGKHWQFAVSTELPNVSATLDSNYRVVAQTVPDIPAYLQYSWNQGSSHIRLSGIFRYMTFQKMADNKPVHNIGWAVQLSGPIAITPKFNFLYQFLYGKGMGSYIADLNDLNLDVVPDTLHNSLQVLPMYGWYAGLQYMIRPNLSLNLTYSQARLFSQNGYAPPTQYKLGQYLEANLWWNITPRFILAAEYLYGTLNQMNDKQGHSNRANLMVMYNF